MFEVSEVVKLKSGGPKMTVSNPSDDSSSVTWFDAEGHIREATLDNALLEKVT
jgi:uncharacterized protein YodC (DUF2158 family)